MQTHQHEARMRLRTLLCPVDPQVDPATLRTLCARAFVLPPDALCVRTRVHRVCAARHVWAVLLLAQGRPAYAVGRILGREHSTILSACQTVLETPCLLATAQTIAQGYPARGGASLELALRHALAALGPAAPAAQAYLDAAILGRPRPPHDPGYRLAGMYALLACPPVLAAALTVLAAWEERGAVRVLGQHAARYAGWAVPA